MNNSTQKLYSKIRELDELYSPDMIMRSGGYKPIESFDDFAYCHYCKDKVLVLVDKVNKKVYGIDGLKIDLSPAQLLAEEMRESAIMPWNKTDRAVLTKLESLERDTLRYLLPKVSPSEKTIMQSILALAGYKQFTNGDIVTFSRDNANGSRSYVSLSSDGLYCHASKSTDSVSVKSGALALLKALWEDMPEKYHNGVGIMPGIEMLKEDAVAVITGVEIERQAESSTGFRR